MAGKLKEKISGALSIPQEIVTDAPKMTLESNTKIFIENYKGVSEYGEENICINTGEYIIALKGERLEIKSMTTEEIAIEGLIKTIDFS